MGKTPEQLFADKFLEMTPEEFDNWADKASLEEVIQATALISIANTQLREQMECLQEEDDCFIEEQLYLDSRYGCFPEASEVLSKFTLKGNT
jgi:hypothetical protein